MGVPSGSLAVAVQVIVSLAPGLVLSIVMLSTVGVVFAMFTDCEFTIDIPSFGMTFTVHVASSCVGCRDIARCMASVNAILFISVCGASPSGSIVSM